MNPWLNVLATLQARKVGATLAAPPEPHKTASGNDATKPTTPPTEGAQDGDGDTVDAAPTVTLFRAKVSFNDATKPTKLPFVGFVAPQHQEKNEKTVTAATTLQNLQNPQQGGQRATTLQNPRRERRAAGAAATRRKIAGRRIEWVPCATAGRASGGA